MLYNYVAMRKVRNATNRRPEYIVAALGSGERERLRTDDYFYYYQNLKSQF